MNRADSDDTKLLCGFCGERISAGDSRCGFCGSARRTRPRPVTSPDTRPPVRPDPAPAAPRSRVPLLFLLLLLTVFFAGSNALQGGLARLGDRIADPDFEEAVRLAKRRVLGYGDFDDQEQALPERLGVSSSRDGELERAAPEGMDPAAFELNQDGVGLFKQGDPEAALEKLGDAYLKVPDDPVIARNYSNVLTYMGWESLKAEEYVDALLQFDRALDINRENVEAWKGSGYSRVRLEETDAAIRDFEEAYRLAPRDAAVGLALARLLYQGDDLPRAKGILEELLREHPQHASATKLLKRVQQEEKVERKFQASDTGHFRLKFDISENSDVGALVSGILEEAYTLIGSRFRHFPTDPVVVILYTREQFQSVSGSPHWSRGVYDGKIRIPVGGVNERTEELEDVIFHEYTHVVVNQITRGRCPTWLNEGLAQHAEPSMDGGKKSLLRMLRRSALVPFSRLEGSFMKLPGDAARIAYAQAYASVLYIAETYSFYHLRSILEGIDGGATPEQAVKSVLHYGYPDLERGIKDYLGRSG